MIAHWDDAPSFRAERGHLAGTWSDLGAAVGSRGVGLKRIRVDPLRWSTPAHRHGAEEEIFYVLAGSGLSWQDGATCEVGPGDCLVHLPNREAHTLRAGPDGLDVLAYGTRRPVEGSHLPRAGVAWLGETWVVAGPGEDPWSREAAAGEPETPEPGPRPANVLALADAPRAFDGQVALLGRTAGAEESGLNHTTLAPGRIGAPPHCHTLEEEIFVVLEGSGALELTPSPARREVGAEPESHPVRAGTVVSRRAGTGIAHNLRAGEEGLVYLAYGTREANDITYYPRSNKFWLRGVGLIGRVEPLPFMEGEEG